MALVADTAPRCLRLAVAGGGDASALSKSDVRGELLYDMVGRLQVRPVMDWPLPTQQHIGLQEMAALAAVARRLARDPRCWEARAILPVDATVIRRAVTRGRSS